MGLDLTPAPTDGGHTTEMVVQPRGTGWVEVIAGPMFSGKTEELIRRLRRAQIAKQVVQVVKPSVDDRYSREDVVSHSEQRLQAAPVKSSMELRDRLSPRTQVLGIDEVQFFDDGIVELVEEVALDGVRVVVAGLDIDYRAEPFGPMPKLMCLAEYVTKLLAICVVCGNPAARNQRVAGGAELVEVGATDRYEARCRACYVHPDHPAVSRMR